MAPSCTIYPEVLPDRVRSNPKLSAEVRFYDLLKQQLGYSWTVYYDVAWLGRSKEGTSQDGQIDFIVAHPAKGVLIIEVKGGKVWFNGPRQQWISTNRKGEDNDINPFDQIRKQKYGLLGKLKSLPALRKKWVELSQSVCFTGSARPTSAVTPESPPEIIIGSDDLGRLQERIEEILAFHHGGPDKFKHGDLIIPQLTQLIARSIELPNPLAAQTIDEDLEIIRLTESQMLILSILSRVRRAAIGGAAGSGKTFLAVEKARLLAGEGFETLLACYTMPLAVFLKSLLGEVENLRVLTVHELAKELTGGGDAAPDALFDVMSAAEERPFDAIIVDEGQDLSSEWWAALESCLREGKESVFYIFHDTHQTLYADGGVLPKDITEYPLEDNVRNTQCICTTLRKHYQGDIPITPRGPAGRNVETVPYETEQELKLRLGKTVERLLGIERLKPNELVVLTPRKLEDSALMRLKLPGGLKLVQYPPATGAREVQCASIDQFKGLERHTAIVVELDEQMPEDPMLRQALLYVACSRPRHHLVLMGAKEIISKP